MTEPADAGAAYEGWAIVELMGHRQRCGRIREVSAFGCNLLRIDIPVPGEAEPVTEFYGGSAIYAIRPVSEAYAADTVRRQGDIRPANPADYQRAIADRSGADDYRCDE